MPEFNPYRSPIVRAEPSQAPCSAKASLAIGFVIDGAAAMACALGASQIPWLRAFLPFAAGHAVAAALIAFRANRNGQSLSAGDHLFLRYGAILMAGATAMIRAIF
jgi:hypothetical protein